MLNQLLVFIIVTRRCYFHINLCLFRTAKFQIMLTQLACGTECYSYQYHYNSQYFHHIHSYVINHISRIQFYCYFHSLLPHLVQYFVALIQGTHTRLSQPNHLIKIRFLVLFSLSALNHNCRHFIAKSYFVFQLPLLLVVQHISLLSPSQSGNTVRLSVTAGAPEPSADTEFIHRQTISVNMRL